MVAVVDQSLKVAALAVLTLPDRRLQGAERADGVHTTAVLPAIDTMGEQAHDEGGAARSQPGRELGEVDHAASWTDAHGPRCVVHLGKTHG